MTASPYTAHLSSFTLTPEQSERIAGMNEFCRNDEIGRLLYRHIYNERCRALHCVELHCWAEAALRDHWQAHREEYVAQVAQAAFPAEKHRRAA